MKKLLLILTIFCLIIPSCKKPVVITLSVDKEEISANGEDIVKFKVIANDEDDVTKESRIFFSGTNKEVGGTSFSTTEPNTYSFYATYDDTRAKEEVRSNTVTIVANEVIDEDENEDGDENEEEIQVEGPIVLSASTDTIAADGKDVIGFTIMQDTVNVTSLSEIFINDSLIEGNEFKTTIAGLYTVIAKKNDTIVSNEITFFAKEVGNNDENEEAIKLTAEPATIIADGKDTVTFSVKQNNNDITKDVEIYINDNKIEGNKFTTETAGTYKAYAKKGELKSNEVTIKAEKAEEKPIELSAEPTTIIANGEDAVTFSVKQDGKDITSETEIYVNDNKIEGNKFTTETAGTYKAYAKKGELKSNEVTITVNEVPVIPEAPIELTADKSSLKANGIDAVTFTVTQDGNDVTNQSEIFVNGGKLNGNKFNTYTAGTYTVYAKKNDVISNELTITAEEVQGGTTIVFAEGVTTTSGWYDVNKVGAGDNGDINMCWSASCANIIQWWQDRYVAAGNTLPANAVTGPGANDTYQLALMDMYHSLWDNSNGANVAVGIEWYFTGRNIEQFASPGSIAVPLDENSGGYYKDIWKSQILPNTYHEYSYVIVPGYAEFHDLISKEVNNYEVWGNGSGLTGIERLKKFSDLVVEYMSRGITSLTISLNSNGGLLHATTLWGYEIDNSTGLLTKIWITDSDDMETEPKTEILHECNVVYDEASGKFMFTGIPRYGSFSAMALCPVSAYGSR